MGQAQAAAQQQALAFHPVGLAQHFDDALGQALGAPWVAAGVQQQGELVAAQARQAVAVLQVRAQARHHLQDQAVAGLVAEGVVDVAEVVQVEVAEGQAAALELVQLRGQQGLEALAVGDAGQRVLLGQALQSGLQAAALAGVAQGTAQHLAAQLRRQPVGHAGGRLRGLALQQQDDRQPAVVPRGQLAGGGQHQADLVLVEQAAGGLPGRRGDQRISVAQRGEMLAQQLGPLRRFSQQEQARGLDRRSQATPMKRKGMPRAPSHAPAIRIGVPAPGRCRLSAQNQETLQSFLQLMQPQA